MLCEILTAVRFVRWAVRALDFNEPQFIIINAEKTKKKNKKKFSAKWSFRSPYFLEYFSISKVEDHERHGNIEEVWTRLISNTHFFVLKFYLVKLKIENQCENNTSETIFFVLKQPFRIGLTSLFNGSVYAEMFSFKVNR